MGRFSTKKKIKRKKCKDDQNGPNHSENSRLNFFIIGGVRSNFRVDFNLILFYFNLIILFLWSYLLKYGR